MNPELSTWHRAEARAFEYEEPDDDCESSDPELRDELLRLWNATRVRNDVLPATTAATVEPTTENPAHIDVVTPASTVEPSRLQPREASAASENAEGGEGGRQERAGVEAAAPIVTTEDGWDDLDPTPPPPAAITPEEVARDRAERQAQYDAADAPRKAKEAECLERAVHERWIPVLREQEVCGFPKYPTASLHHMAEHMSLEDALTRRFAFDAHILAHSNPEVDRRIDQGVFADADALAKIGGAVRMVLLIADVDCDKSHKASGSTGDAPAPDVWRCDEIPKVEALRRVHPDVYSYDTKGGYRLLGWLPTPVLLKSKADADEWSRRYCEWLAYLQIQFQIFADPACKNFGRFQRLPHATRGANAAPEERATIGDPHAIGTIDFPVTTTEITELASTLSAKKEDASGTKKKRRPRKPGERLAAKGKGVLFHAFTAKDELVREVETGKKWEVVCPWASKHTKGGRVATLMAPREDERETDGYVSCFHAHCQTMTARDVRAHFSEAELLRARFRACDSFTPAKETIAEIPRDAKPSEVEKKITDEAFVDLAVNLNESQRLELMQSLKESTDLTADSRKVLTRALEGAVDAKLVAEAKADAEADAASVKSRAITGGDAGVIRVNLELDRMVRETLDVLPTATNLYKRDSRLERIVVRELEPRQRTLDAARQAALEVDPNADTGALRPRAFVERPAGSLAIRSFSPSQLKRSLSLIVGFEHTEWDGDPDTPPETKPCAPPADLLQCVLDDGTWSGVPVLVGVAEHPLVRADGTIAQIDGYDPSTGYVLQIPPRMPPIPESPGLGEVWAAVERLRELVSDFPWTTPADFAAWLALPLTMICRTTIDGPSPLFAVSANTRGAGKSRLVDVASIIVAGRRAARASQPADEPEMGKVLTSIATEADPAVLFDNADRPVGGGKLDAWLTGTRWKDRPLGLTAWVDLPIVTTLAITGNNLTYVGDTIDRVLPIRLESTLENPRARKPRGPDSEPTPGDFKIDNLLGHVAEHRLELLAALLTVARGWFAEGRPSTGGRMGSFEEWSAVVPQIIRWVGLPDPLSTREGIAADDPKDVALRTLIATWTYIERDKGATATGLTVSGLVDAVFDASGNANEITLKDDNGRDIYEDYTPPGERPKYKRLSLADVAAALEQLAPGQGKKERVDAKKLSYVLRGAKGRVIGGKRLVKAGVEHGSLRWTVK